MYRLKDETRGKRLFDSDKKRRDKNKGEKLHRAISEVRKGEFYKLVLNNNTSATGRVVDITEKEIKLSEYTENDVSVSYEQILKRDRIHSIEPMVASLRNEITAKENVVIVTMITGTTGYGELQKETKASLILKNFVFFSDGSIPYDITIRKELVKEYLKLSTLVRESDSESSEKSFQIDSEIGKKKPVKQKELQPFFGREASSHKETLPRTHREWNQFEENERRFGLKATFDESVYTTVLDKNSKEYKMYAQEAETLARKIDGLSSSNMHLEEERGRISDRPEDEKYGTVMRAVEKEKETPQSDSQEDLTESSTNTEAKAPVEMHVPAKAPSRPASPKKKPDLKVIPLNFFKEGATGDFSDRVFSSLKGKKKSEPQAAPVEERLRKVSIVSGQRAEASEQAQKPERPALKKLNVDAQSFDPTTAVRNNFFIKVPKSKKLNAWGKDGKVLCIPWGTGKSFLSVEKRGSHGHLNSKHRQGHAKRHDGMNNKKRHQ
ncbi:uncharacterized protein NEMAJ01_2212 [Nematocida major]|uniref:uncharacterized protein n=1 Tax=Nematocida major TaxID=1912982 RepID=UPI002008E530|nr:uncharacterized protein NEMAJ01_2212 [Nematocida major]KAH9387316.1 hypothetical protein NEMAJ01_2212 [Nematocida major]